MLSEQLCKKLNRSPWDLKIPDCCHRDEPGDRAECDCCYDEWQKQLEGVRTRFSEVEEKARLKGNELSFIKGRRDTLKAWYDELVIVSEKSREICNTLDILLNQMEKISTNTQLAVNALKILYCMLRDFYRQLDKIKLRYDQLQNCIRCLNDPVLVPGQGIMKCLEEYGRKLDVVLATRDELLRMLLEVISVAMWIHQSLAKDWGLYNLVQELREIVKWDMNCDTDAPVQTSQLKFRQEGTGQGREQENDEPLCPLEPLVPMPMNGKDYCRYIWQCYADDKSRVDKLEKELLDLNKEKEVLEACRNSLVAAIVEVDPKNRC